jgi:hypothetical protein
VQVRGRPFLSEYADDNRWRYYKGGLGVIRRYVESSPIICVSVLAVFLKQPSAMPRHQSQASTMFADGAARAADYAFG